jgi:hypothetical protein
MYRPIPGADRPPVSDSGGGSSAVVFVIGLVGGIVGVGLYEWKSRSLGPQPAEAKVSASVPEAVAGTVDARSLQPRGAAKPSLQPANPASGVAAGGAPKIRIVEPARTEQHTKTPTRAQITASGSSSLKTESHKSRRAVGTAGVVPDSVTIGRLLVGAEVLRAGLVKETQARELARSDRYLVYFGLSVAGANGRATYEDFRLEDASGLIYKPLRTRDALGTDGAPSAGAGGVAFAVYNDSAPARLLVRAGGERFVALPENIFRRK